MNRTSGKDHGTGWRIFRHPVPLFLAACLLLAPALWAQKGPRPFAYGYQPKGRYAQGGTAAYKFRVAQGVFERLVQARGDAQLEPRFVMDNGERFVAWCDPSRNEVGLEELAYDVCVAMGPDSLDALAFLLAHELVHHYDKHDWNRAFVRGHEQLAVGKELAGRERQDTLLEHLRYETQADHLGGFLAQRAGFKPFRGTETLLERVYEAYGLPDRLPSYPSRQERAGIARASQRSLDTLTLLHEIAGMLTLAGDHDAAARCYEPILRQFPSRDIYGNAGMIHLLAALDRFEPSEFPWYLPVQWDPRPRTNTRSGKATRVRERREHLKRALDLLGKATRMDETYTPAWVNLACARVLAEADSLEFRAKAAIRNLEDLPEHPIADALVLQGILLARSGDHKGAAAHWKEAEQAGASIAAWNLLVLEGKPLQQVKAMPLPEAGILIEGITLDDHLDAYPSRFDREVGISDDAYGRSTDRPASRILEYGNEDPNALFRSILSQECLTCSETTDKGIAIGSSMAEVLGSYGTPSATLSLPEGELLVYGSGKEKLFFRVMEEVVVSWGVVRRY